MQSYPARLASFAAVRPKAARWPHPNSFVASPTALAAAGFYFNPSPAALDAVSCFLCNKGLADWDPHDVPALIHADKCPKCPWAILRCIEDPPAPGGSITFSSPSRLPTSRHMENARLATFGPETKRWWPHDAKSRGPSAIAMAKAGFIYTPAGPKDDTCLCIYCHTELAGWLPDDDPMEEHRRRQFKNGPCPFFTTPSPRSTAKPHSKIYKPSSTTPNPSDLDDHASDSDLADPLPIPPAISTFKASARTQPGSKRARKSTKPTKTPRHANEVVEEYQIALAPSDDDATRTRPRSKPLRASSRASSARTASSSMSASPARKSSAKTPQLKRTSPAPSVASSRKSARPKAAAASDSGSEDAYTARSSRSKDRNRSCVSRKKTQQAEGDEDRDVAEDAEPAPKLKRKGRAKAKARAKGKGKTRAEEWDDADAAHDESEPMRGRTAQTDHEAGPQPARGRNKTKVQDESEPTRGRKVPPHEEPERQPARGRSKIKVAVENEKEQKTPSSEKRSTAPKLRQGDSPSQEHAQDRAHGHTRGQDSLAPTSVSRPLPHLPLPNSTHSPHSDPHRPPPAPRPRSPPHHPHVPQPPPSRPFQTPEDEELAREEQALEEQARSLMRAQEPALAPVPVPPLVHAGPPPPSTPPAPPPAPTHTASPLAAPLPVLTPAERAMTVEQWVRYEMERQYERLQSDGRRRIEAFKARAEEVARRIEEL